MRQSKRGFTLLEVMVAGGLFALVTAAAMASYVLQVQLTNTQQQSTNATDEVRAGLQVISNDVRAAAPGINAGMLSGGMGGAIGGTSNSVCPLGTIPFSSATVSMACLPPVFRSTSPTVPLGAALPGGFHCVQATSPGYQLVFNAALNQIAPNPANNGMYFCPDDLVVLAVDDADSFFTNGYPGSSTAGAANVNFLFMPPLVPTPNPNTPGETTFDEAGISALTINPMVLISGAEGPVLMTTGAVGVTKLYTTNTDPGAIGNFGYVPVTLGPTQNDLFGTLGPGFPVAMPARLVQYSISPVADPVTGNFVSGNLVRTELTPLGAAVGGSWFAAISNSTVLVHGVIDMQVEFGLDPTGSGQLRYVSSGGYQSAPSPPPVSPPAVPPAAEVPENHVAAACGGAANGSTLFGGTCFPTGGPAPFNDLQYLRSVRVNVLVRAGTINNSRTQTARTSTAGIAAPFMLQPAIQDISAVGGNGNLEAQNWLWAPGFAGYATIDGAEYREVSTEIFVRNLGLTNNF